MEISTPFFVDYYNYTVILNIIHSSIIHRGSIIYCGSIIYSGLSVLTSIGPDAEAGAEVGIQLKSIVLKGGQVHKS